MLIICFDVCLGHVHGFFFFFFCSGGLHVGDMLRMWANNNVCLRNDVGFVFTLPLVVRAIYIWVW